MSEQHAIQDQPQASLEGFYELTPVMEGVTEMLLDQGEVYGLDRVESGLFVAAVIFKRQAVDHQDFIRAGVLRGYEKGFYSRYDDLDVRSAAARVVSNEAQKISVYGFTTAFRPGQSQLSPDEILQRLPVISHALVDATKEFWAGTLEVTDKPSR